MITVTLDGGLEVWGIEFIQWIEQQLDKMEGLERVGKSVTDDKITIRLRPKVASTDHLMSWTVIKAA